MIFENLKKHSQKVISFGLAIIMILILVIGTIALYTDRDSKIVTAKAGSVKIELDYSGINLLDKDGKDILNPGDGRDFNYKVTSLGSKSIDVYETIVLTVYDKNSKPLSLNEIDTEFDIYEAADVLYEQSRGWYIEDGTEPIEVRVLDDNTITYTRPVYTLSGNSELNDDKREIEYDDNDEEIPDYKENDFTLLFDLFAPNVFSGCILKTDVLVEAKQHRNTEQVDIANLQTSDLIISNGNVIKVVPADDEMGPQESEDGNWIYKDNGDGTVTIVDTNKVIESGETLLIPGEIDGKDVTGVEIDKILNNENIDEDINIDFEDPDKIEIKEDLIFTYTNDVEGSNITGLTPIGAKMSSVTIPETIKGQKVLDVDYEGILNSSKSSFLNSIGKTLQSIFIEGDVIANEGIDTVLTYSDNGDGTATITGFTKVGKIMAAHINIPEEINGLTVTKLSTTRDAFTDSSMTELTIPSTVTNIVNFSGVDGSRDKNLKTINLNTAFSNYNSSSASVFAGFPVETVNINASTSTLGNSLFRGFLSTDLTINSIDPITTIDQYAFAGTKNLENITLNDEVMMVDGVLTIPASITTIGKNAFLESFSITEVTIPSTVTSINTGVFTNCTSIKTATINTATIPNETFKGCTALENVIISDNVNSIGESAFYGCSTLKEIDIPNTVTNIGKYAFRNTDITEVVIPDSVTKTGYAVFQDCKSLTDVTIGTGITALAADFFMGCTALENVNIPNTVTSIASRAFYNCTSISEITIPASVTTIEKNVFYGWTADQTIYVEGKTDVSEFATSTGLTDNANLTIVFK